MTLRKRSETRLPCIASAVPFIQTRAVPSAATGFPLFPVAAYLITRFDRAEYRVPLQYIPLEQS
jgi:hypothetical protein